MIEIGIYGMTGNKAHLVVRCRTYRIGYLKKYFKTSQNQVPSAFGTGRCPVPVGGDCEGADSKSLLICS